MKEEIKQIISFIESIKLKKKKGNLWKSSSATDDER